jgi:hypothetical protein
MGKLNPDMAAGVIQRYAKKYFIGKSHHGHHGGHHGGMGGMGGSKGGMVGKAMHQVSKALH